MKRRTFRDPSWLFVRLLIGRGSAVGAELSVFSAGAMEAGLVTRPSARALFAATGVE